MLAQILQDEIKQRGISSREAGRQCGVAHTTIMRIIEGKNVDLATVKAVGKWLNIDVANLLNTDGKATNVAPTIAAFLDKNPKLKTAFMNAIAHLQNGEIKNTDIEDILAYVAFRIGIAAK
jgi:transcriptional regulator with XRE-family HTH domain